MKKLLLLATVLGLSGCYAPLNNSGVSTNKAWLDIPAKKIDFEGKQYDSCYQFRLHFVPAEAAAQLDLLENCIDTCCWRSAKNEVVLDFNKNFEKNLQFYGRADKFTPGKITFKITHSNLLNTTAVHVSPRGAVSLNGTVKLKHKTVENAAQLAQREQEQRRQQTLLRAEQMDQQQTAQETALALQNQQRAKSFVQRVMGPKIDQYFYQINKKYSQKGYIFFISNRLYEARLLPDGNYQVICHAQVQSGPETGQLTSRSLSCGTWKVSLATQTVLAADSVARRIKSQS